jgi:GTP-binding protein
MNSSYITSAAQAQQLPDLGGGPEIAFIGRSNCGKSSLLNALLGRTNLARESKTPGRTQMVNFFDVTKGDTRLILADLPGYGYSATGREVRQHWQALVEAYLARPTIVEFLFLVDVRRAGDLDDQDLGLLGYLASKGRAVPVTVVLTKTDKATQKEIATAQNTVRTYATKLRLPQVQIVAVSSLKKKGIDGLRDRLLGYMAPVG